MGQPVPHRATIATWPRPEPPFAPPWATPAGRQAGPTGFTWTSFPCSRSRTLNPAIDHPEATIDEGQQYERVSGPCPKAPRQTSEYTVTGLPWSLLVTCPPA